MGKTIAGMRALPVGVPKVCVSTAASGDTSAYVGTKDVTLIPSIVDVAGINRVSRIIFARAAGAICGMVESDLPVAATDKPIIAASMFGNTTECVDACRAAAAGEDTPGATVSTRSGEPCFGLARHGSPLRVETVAPSG